MPGYSGEAEANTNAEPELVGRSGSLAHLHATGTILNNNGAETWNIATLTR